MRLLLAVLLVLFGAAAAHAAGPSFDCAKVTSTVNKLICASPDLSALDQKLSDDFKALHAQGGVEPKAVESEENMWLHGVRNQCKDAACLAKAYADRDAIVLSESKTAASPAAAAETQQFDAPPGLFSEAQSFLGQSCKAKRDIFSAKGFGRRDDYQPVLIEPDYVVEPHIKSGVWFAFLLDLSKDGCIVADVVSLPSPKQANAFLQCEIPADDGSATPQSYGIGMRLTGKTQVVGYWDVPKGSGHLQREPLDVLNWTGKIRCNYPETGD